MGFCLLFSLLWLSVFPGAEREGKVWEWRMESNHVLWLGSELTLSWSGSNKSALTVPAGRGVITKPFSPRPPPSAHWCREEAQPRSVGCRLQRKACLVHEVFANSLFLCSSLACLCPHSSFSLIMSLTSPFSDRFRSLKMIGTTGVQSHL